MSFKKVFDLINSNSYKEENIKNAVSDKFQVVHDLLVLEVDLLRYACLKKNLELVKLFNLKNFQTDSLLKFVREFDLGKDIYDYLVSSGLTEDFDKIKENEIDNKYLNDDIVYESIKKNCENLFCEKGLFSDNILRLKKEDLNKIHGMKTRKSRTYIRHFMLNNTNKEYVQKLIERGADPFIRYNTLKDNEHIFCDLNEESFKIYLPILLSYIFKNKKFEELRFLKNTSAEWFLELYNSSKEEEFTLINF